MSQGLGKTGNVISGLSTLLLALGIAFMHLKVVPVFVAVFAGMGRTFWAPARLAIQLASWMTPALMMGVLLAVLFVARQKSPEGRASATGLVIGVGNLLLVLYLLLQFTIFINFTINLPGIIGRLRQSAIEQGRAQ